MSAQNKPLILVDGSSYLYRAFHALPALMNSKGFPTGAVYGLVNMLKRLLADYEPKYIAVVFDSKGKTFRDDMYPAYKATRHDMPHELVDQIAPIHEIIHAMGLPIIMIEGVEADDVIGTLAQEATKQGMDTLISTGDKDLAQLVNSSVTLINTMTNTKLDPEGVVKKFGVPPERIIDYLTLIGDTSDNIPGVAQVGPKTAVKWLQSYLSLDNIIASANKISGKVGENLRTALPQLPLTKSLVTIKLDVKLPIELTDLQKKPMDKARLIDLFKEMEFKNWLKELLEEPAQKQNKAHPTSHLIIHSQEDFAQWIKKLQNAQTIAFDIETTTLDYMSAKLVGVSFAIEKEHVAYVPFGHDYPHAPKQLSESAVLTQLKVILENTLIKKIGHNVKYVREVLANYNINLQGISYDTMLESYILDSTSSYHDLESLALKYLGLRSKSFIDIVGKGNKQVTLNVIDIETVGAYATEKVDIILKLHEILWARIQAEKGLAFIFTHIEMPLLSVLANMERTGVLIDPALLKKQGVEIQKRLLELEKEAFALAGESFNLNSPKQLQEILFQKLKLPILQKTPTGQASTADNVLQELALDFPMPKVIIEYRSLSKLMSTYTTRLVDQINPSTGRIHTSYNQTGAATGRLSSSEPNLQNIPIRTMEGRRIRQAFIAPQGYKIVSADYSQIELRLMAHISADPTLMKAFANNLDIHKATAAEVWDVPLDKVTPDMRRDAKTINFGLIYGMSAFGLTRQLNIKRQSAQEYIDRYFTRYPNVRQYMDNTRKQAKQKGYVETLWGRRLYLPDINASQAMRQKAAERTAINAPLQGSAADIIKLAMIHIDHWLEKESIDARMIMQVHDELVFEVAEENLDTFILKVKEHMTNDFHLNVPLVVAVGVGNNWDEASNH